MKVLIKGAGDLASGVALRLSACGFSILMTEIPHPMAIRRTVCFSEAVLNGATTVETTTARRIEDLSQAQSILEHGEIPVLCDPELHCLKAWAPEVLIEATLSKKNTGISMLDAPIVLALGPGYSAGTDCHAVIETMRGHSLGRVIYQGPALPNTGIPGEIGGQSAKRVLRAPANGRFEPICSIGDLVHQGDLIATVDGTPLLATIDGTLRGILPAGTTVTAGMKSGDIDPRGVAAHCFTVSDKALSIAGGVLEAILHLSQCIHA